MVSEKQLEANHQNALRSTGPKTVEGVEAVKLNALRHGLRSVQTVVLGEDSNAWECHRTAIVEDLKPAGAIEYALAEQVAAKLWRLGRVIRFEADVITNGQANDEIRSAHEMVLMPKSSYLDDLDRTGIPKFKDVKSARNSVQRAAKRLSDREIALRVLEGLEDMKDGDFIRREDWPVWDALKEDLELGDRAEKVFEGEEDFVARHIRLALKLKGKEKDVKEGLISHWRDTKIPELREKVTEAKKVLNNVSRRYREALDRLRLSRGLPDDGALEKVQRYEAHLEARTSQSPGPPPDASGSPWHEPDDN